MTTIKICNPEQLRSAIPAIKSPEDARHAENAAKVWSIAIRLNMPGTMDIHIEIGRDAKMIRKKNGRPDTVWELHLRKAREIVRALE